MPPSIRLMGICPWMESDFHNRIDYYGVAFSIDWNGGAHFWDFGFKKSQVRRNLKRGRFAVKKLLLYLMCQFIFKMTHLKGSGS